MKEPGQEVVEKRFLATEKMGAAGNVEIKAVFAVERHQRRIAAAPVRKPFQKGAIRHPVGGQHIDIRAHGPRLGNTLAQLEP
ncbi:hypothetical protein D9M72_537180 [compost metagenome]